MEKKRLTKYVWWGSDVDKNGNPILPGAASAENHLDGLNVGEVFIHVASGSATLWTATPEGKIVQLSGADIDNLYELFLSKTKDDRSKGIIASDKGMEVGTFQEGNLGSGAATFMRDGSSYSEVDFLKVRKKATFTNLTIQELKHVGGEIILSPAAMVCSKVEEVEDGYKCYFNTEDSDGRKVYNEFEAGDQAKCETFNLEHNKYYWRLVVEVGDDFIVLSKTDCDANSDIPSEGDNISQLGNRTDASKQAAIILSAYGSDAPSYKQYNGINSYSLEGKQVTKLSPFGNELTGKMTIESGSKGWENLEGLEDTINNQSSNLEEFANVVTKEFDAIRNEMDGAIDTWFGDGEPTLGNYPAVEWVTTEDKDSHLGDLYYSEDGKAYRFMQKNGAYLWSVIEDSEVVKALELAQKALDTADGKRRVFISQPVPPYDLGDLWAGGADADLMRCVRKRESGAFDANDWDLADNSRQYADAIKKALEEEVSQVVTDAEQAISDALESSKSYTDEARAAIQETVDALNRDKANASDVYAKALVDGMVSHAEAEAIRQANETAAAQRELLEVQIKAWADGEISDAEQRAINEAQSKVDAAKQELEEAMNEMEGELNDKMDNLEYGKNNLLLNSGFTGDFVTASLRGGYILEGDAHMFSPSLKYWDYKSARAVDSLASESTMAAVISDGGFISQTLTNRVIPEEHYVFSFQGKGGNLIFTLGEVTKIFEMSDVWDDYVFKFHALGEGNVFRLEAEGECMICELQLERGTLKSAWGMSPLDNRSELAKYETLTYLKGLLRPDVQTTIDGGTINTGLITMGKVSDEGNLSEITAGVSGQYMDNDSVAFWAGGKWEDAIFAVNTYLDNPNYTPTEEELRNMAHYVVTHGGRAILNDVILRGYIYALGGKFKGEVEATSGKFNGAITAKSMNLSVTEGGDEENPTDLTTSGGFRLEGYYRLPLLKDDAFTELVGFWVSGSHRSTIMCTILCNESLIEVLYYNGTMYNGVSQINISHEGGYIKASMMGHQYSEWGGQCWNLNIEKSSDVYVEIISHA